MPAQCAIQWSGGPIRWARSVGQKQTLPEKPADHARQGQEVRLAGGVAGRTVRLFHRESDGERGAVGVYDGDGVAAGGGGELHLVDEAGFA